MDTAFYVVLLYCSCLCTSVLPYQDLSSSTRGPSVLPLAESSRQLTGGPLAQILTRLLGLLMDALPQIPVPLQQYLTNDLLAQIPDPFWQLLTSDLLVQIPARLLQLLTVMTQILSRFWSSMVSAVLFGTLLLMAAKLLIRRKRRKVLSQKKLSRKDRKKQQKTHVLDVNTLVALTACPLALQGLGCIPGPNGTLMSRSSMVPVTRFPGRPDQSHLSLEHIAEELHKVSAPWNSTHEIRFMNATSSSGRLEPYIKNPLP